MKAGWWIREAAVEDIPVLHSIRMAVKENVLSHPDRVRAADYLPFITMHGKGWVSEDSEGIRGFAIVDTAQHNVWALFVHPDWEGRGMGRELQRRMLDWYFERWDAALWLTTGQHTRAELFYIATGWRKAGLTATGEWRFELEKGAWTRRV